jgi:hypothetical protein
VAGERSGDMLETRFVIFQDWMPFIRQVVGIGNTHFDVMSECCHEERLGYKVRKSLGLAVIHT